MVPERLYDELVGHAQRLGVGVRVEPFRAKILERRGGMCVVNGERVIMMDAALPIVDRVAILASALVEFGVSSIAYERGARWRLRKAL